MEDQSGSQMRRPAEDKPANTQIAHVTGSAEIEEKNQGHAVSATKADLSQLWYMPNEPVRDTNAPVTSTVIQRCVNPGGVGSASRKASGALKRLPSPSPLLDLLPPPGIKVGSEEIKQEVSASSSSDALHVNMTDATSIPGNPHYYVHCTFAHYTPASGLSHGDSLQDLGMDRSGIVSDPLATHQTNVTETWLLDAAVSSCTGMLVEVHGSRQFRHDIAWHGGDYERARGVVLSVLNAGVGNESFPSTARVKFEKSLNPLIDTLAVPVSLLRPIQPDADGQDALIIGGNHKGHTAKLLETAER